ncbi:ribulose-phosphate 3-epimerase [Enterococcus sp. AZ072]|uniref:ribulose-phosphate 3-epimerase n=1 Tax=unclassified Enterococcus TaxID=2608891 RepID=UPI003D2DCE53
MSKVVASIMCADQLNLAKELRSLNEAGIDWLHCDVMDGQFVNNLAMGPYVLEPIIQTQQFTTDIHLACVTPEKYVSMFVQTKPDYITFHIETVKDPSKIIDQIHASNCGVGIAVSPETPIESIFPFLDDLELVLIMTVNPGFAGQPFQHHVLDKIARLNQELSSKTTRPLIEVDGNIYAETAKAISQFGADLYVVGTSALFNKKTGSYRDKVQAMEQSIN